MSGITTIGAAWRIGWTAHARCGGRSHATPKSSRPCGFSAQLDMLTLLMTRGPNFPLEMLPARLMCPRCGERSLAVVYFATPERTRDAG